MTLLAFEVFLCLGLFIGFDVVFGHGLGDLFYYAILYLVTITHVVLTIRFRRAAESKFVTLLFIFSIITILLCLKATIWRGPEYSWKNRKLFMVLVPGWTTKNAQPAQSQVRYTQPTSTDMKLYKTVRLHETLTFNYIIFNFCSLH